jgi:hypothetical protein
MTCAGISSVIIALGKSATGDAQVVDGRVECCGPQRSEAAVERALQWLASKFAVNRNPGRPEWLYYYLYGVERVGRLTGHRFIGRHDWFREGAEFLVGQQAPLTGYWRGEGSGEDYPVIATSFALLFLAKGQRPVVVSKLKYGDDATWDLHRGAIENLTRSLEQRWHRDLTWQTVDLQAASPEELLESPVLFLSGRDAMSLTGQQKQRLREYINRGGFLFAEACCDGAAFDRDFRALMRELFPDSSLRLLSPDHPVWFAEQPVDPEFLRPLYGIEACCRISVVFCPKDLSCYWELGRPERSATYPEPVLREIEACLRIGQNVVAYATNRELRSRLDQPLLAPRTAVAQPARGVLHVPKLLHSGGGDDAPNALPNLLQFLGHEARMRVNVENRTLSAEDPALFEYPLLFIHGRRDFRFTATQRTALRAYLDRGGVILGDAICSSPEFAAAFRREFVSILGGAGFERIPPQHPLFTRDYGGFDLASVTLRDPQVRQDGDALRASLNRVSPLLEAATLEDRLAVVLSPYDLSCALENSTSLECKSYLRDDAARLATNVILYALQQ